MMCDIQLGPQWYEHKPLDTGFQFTFWDFYNRDSVKYTQKFEN